MKTILKLFLGILSVFFLGGTVASATGLNWHYTTGAVTGIAVITSIVRPNGVLAGVAVEMWTGELIQKFRHVKSWLSVVPDRNEFVNKNAIHLADVGADPSVLINNTTYPITTTTRDDGDVVVALNKYDTTNTKITQDELYGLPYDKPGSVMETHRMTLEEKTGEHSAFLMAPTSHSAATPVLLTTGATNAISRKACTAADIARLKLAFDNAKVPAAGRVLVLCPQHVNDLLAENQTFRDRFIDTTTGKAMNFYGFQIFEDPALPIYNSSNTKKAFGSAYVSGSGDKMASIAFFAPRTFKARGDVMMFYRDASISPETRDSTVGFRLWFLAMPKKAEAIGAILSDV